MGKGEYEKNLQWERVNNKLGEAVSKERIDRWSEAHIDTLLEGSNQPDRVTGINIDLDRRVIILIKAQTEPEKPKSRRKFKPVPKAKIVLPPEMDAQWEILSAEIVGRIASGPQGEKAGDMDSMGGDELAKSALETITKVEGVDDVYITNRLISDFGKREDFDQDMIRSETGRGLIRVMLSQIRAPRNQKALRF